MVLNRLVCIEKNMFFDFAKILVFIADCDDVKSHCFVLALVPALVVPFNA